MSDRRRLDPARVGRIVVLVAWAGFFAYLWASGDVVRYLGPRTYWVVVFGTVTLIAAAISSLSMVRRGSTGQLTVGQFLGYLLILLPIAVVVMAPDAELGALAVSRKLVGDDTRAVIIPQFDPDRPVSFIDLAYGSRSPEYAKAAGIEAGRELELVGFVTHEGGGKGFRLSRFYISCCAADAIPYSTDILTEDGSDYADDTWLQVKGTIESHEGGFALKASHINEVEEPDPPYL
ncbi:MAG: hypothetical protein QOG54_820 [Actinomycetota bacterium]|jgi:uncharacterized repeat protein (TIGR03943 family)|nr:hypothetical protein [Actinomycetota bacterium]